jgi:hypothetical protein
MSPVLLMAGLALGGILAGGIRAGLKAILPKRPGHVAHCLAFQAGGGVRSESAGKVLVSVSLGNRAFAALWAQEASVGPVASLRKRLIAECEALHERALERKDGNYRSGQEIREGIVAARRVIEEIPVGGKDPAGYLRAILEGLERKRGDLDKTRNDEDGWALGGLRSVANKVEELAGRSPLS